MLHDANDNFGFGDMWYHGFRNNCIVEQNNMLRDSSYIRSAIFDNTRSSFMDNMALFGDYDHSIFTSLNQNISNQNISDNLPNHHYHHNNQFNSNLPQVCLFQLISGDIIFLKISTTIYFALLLIRISKAFRRRIRWRGGGGGNKSTSGFLA